MHDDEYSDSTDTSNDTENSCESSESSDYNDQNDWDDDDLYGLVLIATVFLLSTPCFSSPFH